MPLEEPDRQYWQAAWGYVELGMFTDAAKELEKIDPFCRATPEVLAVRVAIYHGLKKWDLLQIVAKKLAEFEAQNLYWIVSYAYATRRVESIEAAKEILRNAESRFPKEGIIFYNLACYECQIGRIDSAKEYLKRAFEIDPSWRLQALEDEDLKPLWDSLQATIE
jgi:tetratricopeptide (TPR) repeat protein